MAMEVLYGGRLPDVDGKRWVGNESNGHFLDSRGNWVDAIISTESKLPRIEILDEESSPFIGIPRRV